MEPMMVLPIASLMMNVTPSTTSLNEEETEVKFALSVTIAKDYFKNNMVSVTKVFGARLATAIPFNMAVVSLEEFKRKFRARRSGLAWWIGRYRLARTPLRNGGNIGDLSQFVVWLPLMMQPAMAIIAAAILAWLLLAMVTMTSSAFKLIVQKVLAMFEQAVAQCDRFDGNNLHRVLVLPMSETYLQLVRRAPRTLAIRNSCRDMVTASTTTLIVRASRTLAVFNDCRDLIVRATRTLAIYNPCRALVVISSKTLTIYSACRALVSFASTTLAIYNTCRDVVPVITALALRAPRSLAKHGCRALVAIVVFPTTLAIYIATCNVVAVRAVEDTAEDNDTATIPADVPQEDSFVLKFLRMLLGALRIVGRELIDIIVAKCNRLVAFLFPIVEQEEASSPEVELEEEVEPETEPEKIEQPPVYDPFRHRHTVLGKIKRKRDKKILKQRVQEWQGFS